MSQNESDKIISNGTRNASNQPYETKSDKMDEYSQQSNHSLSSCEYSFTESLVEILNLDFFIRRN